MWQEIITWFPTSSLICSSAVYQRGTVNCHEDRVDRDSDRDSIRLTGWDSSTLGKRCTLLHCTTSLSSSPSSVDRHLVYDALDLFLYILVHISMFWSVLVHILATVCIFWLLNWLWIVTSVCNTNFVYSDHIFYILTSIWMYCILPLVFMSCHPGVIITIAVYILYISVTIACTGSRHPLCLSNWFWVCFLLRLSRIHFSQVISMGKFGPTALNCV